MELHNTTEEMVVTRVDEIFDAINRGEGTKKYCVCDQCRIDIVCYTLNRAQPHYIISNRGVSRVQQETIERQQQLADITALIHDGFRQINHNRRPYCELSMSEKNAILEKNTPMFNIPVIMGRLFDGNNFAPISEVDVELLRNGELVKMKDGNWQNPCRIVSNAEGAFSFWPVPAKASVVDEPKVFEFTLQVKAPAFDTLTHTVKISVTSEVQTNPSFAMKRTYKLPHLYMFPPGEAEING